MRHLNLIAVVVTYNRADLVIQTIKSILNQSVKVDRIIVIDNSENNSTRNLIQRTFKQNQRISYIKTTQNNGGSGGFALGMKIALQESAQWVWLMDDDVAPEPDCLKHLLKFKSISKCLHPKKIMFDNQNANWEGTFNPDLCSVTYFNDISFKNGKAFCTVNYGCFEGMLVSTEIIKKIGTPFENFFLVHDDLLFGWLASHHTNVLYVRDARINKIIPSSSRYTPRYCYYYMRNLKMVMKFVQLYYPKRHILRHLNYLRMYVKFLTKIQESNNYFKYFIALNKGVLAKTPEIPTKVLVD